MVSSYNTGSLIGEDIVISEKEVRKMVVEAELKIEKLLEKKKYEDALSLISICASVLYSTNICYIDRNLESSLERVARETEINIFEDKEAYAAKEEILLFYDGFGLNDRGLIQIYLKALCKIKKVVYVTYEDRKGLIPDVHNILDEYRCEKRYLNRRKTSNMNLISQLNDIVKEFRPSHMFFYSVPDDVIATSIMYAYEGFITRYQINLTDHAFWLGARCIDRCIEFREYGAQISNEYREIPKSKIVVVPFYPILHKEKEFLGWPFEVKSNQKVIFSGGALYKTLGGNNKYYKIVNYILENHEDVIFWYAGNGDDSEMKKIIAKYPGRAFITGERSDLFQILERSRFYLSTYPMCGGLMFQYAALAGCVPVTLRSGNISDGFLINQNAISIEFEDLESLYEEVDKLLRGDAYAQSRGELMKNSVITPEVFEEAVRRVVAGEEIDNFKVNFEHIDTENFRAWYLENLKKVDIDSKFIKRNAIKIGITYYPLRFLRGGMHMAKKMIMKHLSK